MIAYSYGYDAHRLYSKSKPTMEAFSPGFGGALYSSSHTTPLIPDTPIIYHRLLGPSVIQKLRAKEIIVQCTIWRREVEAVSLCTGCTRGMEASGEWLVGRIIAHVSVKVSRSFRISYTTPISNFTRTFPKWWL